MIKIVTNFFLLNWQRKLCALILSVVIWLTVNNSITATKRFLNVPVRIIHMGKGQTVKGLTPGGKLENQTLELVLTGRKYILKNLRRSDIEIVLNAKGKSGLWQPSIKASNIHSANSKKNLSSVLSEVSASPIILHIVPLIQKMVTVYVTVPKGDDPPGYSFLNVWPQKFDISVSGSKREVEFLEERGLPLQFDLGQIHHDELDRLASQGGSGNEIVRFEVPESWKRVQTPFPPYREIPISDKRAAHIYINFLKEKLIPLHNQIPVSLFFSNPSKKFNPSTIQLSENESIRERSGLFFLRPQLFIYGTSSLFANLVKDYLQVTIYLDKKVGDEPRLQWTLTLIGQKKLMKEYIAAVVQREKITPTPSDRLRIQERFESCVQNMRLFTGPDHPLMLKLKLENELLVIDSVLTPKKAVSLYD